MKQHFKWQEEAEDRLVELRKQGYRKCWMSYCVHYGERDEDG